MPTNPTSRRRNRTIPIGLLVGVFASVVAHAAAAWTMLQAARAPRIGAESNPSDADFVELPPVVAAPTDAPTDPDVTPSATPEVRSAPSGLRVRRPSSLPHLSLATFDESTGPFGLRDRLTIGRLDPHVIPILVRTPTRHEPAAPESEAPSESATDAASTTHAEDATAEPDETPELEPETTDTAPTEVPETADTTPDVPPGTTDVATDDPARLRPGVLAEDTVRLELPTAPRSPITEGALDAIAGASLRQAVGLEDASLRRALRVRPRGSGSIVTAFATTLEASELRARLEAALVAAGVTPNIADVDGTYATTVVVDGVEHAVIIDGSTLVLSDVGAQRLAAQAVSRVRAEPDVADPAPVPLVAAHLTTRPPSPTLSLDIQLFEPTDVEPRTRVRVHATLRPVEEAVEPAPGDVDAIVAYARQTAFPDAAFELASPAVRVGHQVSFEAFVGNVDVGALATSLSRVR